MPEAAVPTHRFTLSPDVEALLDRLSLDGFPALSRSAADERWAAFVEENETVIGMERRRLAEMGYRGDLSTKMYRSARYYRGSRHAAGSSTPATRREYIATPEHLLRLMDAHVEAHCFGEQPLSPRAGWEAFRAEHPQAVTLAEQDLVGTDRLTADAAREKVKKAYKNRHFLSRRKRKVAAARATAIAALPE